MRKNRPNPVYPAVLGIKLSLLLVCALGESALPSASVSGLRSLLSSGGALPPGAQANEMRKNRPNPVYPAVLGINLSLLMVCALGESALPSASGLWSLIRYSRKWHPPCKSSRTDSGLAKRRKPGKVRVEQVVPTSRVQIRSNAC